MCKLSDIEYLEDITVIYSVDSDGEPDAELDHTGGDFLTYRCSCGEEFDNFDKVKAHIE